MTKMPTDEELQKLFEFFKEMIMEAFTEGPEEKALQIDDALFSIHESMVDFTRAVLNRRDEPGDVLVAVAEIGTWALIAQLLIVREDAEIKEFINDALKPKD